MGFINVMEYIFGLGIFGFIRWFLDEIILQTQVVARTGDTQNLALYIWDAVIVVYIIVGALWLINKFSEEAYMRKLRGF